MNIKGFTFVEMLVSLMVSAVVVLTIGSISGICRNSELKTRSESQIFDDIAYGFKLLQNRVHEGKSLEEETLGGHWLGNQLVIDHDKVFGVFQDDGSAVRELVYLPDKSDETARQVIIGFSASDSVTLDVAKNGSKSVSVSVSGEKGNIPFSSSTDVMRRN